jgi:hypothetical protein
VLQVTAASDQEAAARTTSTRVPGVSSDENRYILAEATTHPSGTAAGIAKRTSARARPLTSPVSTFTEPASTFSTASPPFAAVGLFSSSQVSATTGTVTVVGTQAAARAGLATGPMATASTTPPIASAVAAPIRTCANPAPSQL